MAAPQAAAAEVVVDASVWVARYLVADVHHAESVAWLTRQIGEVTFLVGPALLLPEVAAAIARRTGDATLAAAAIAHLRRFPLLRLEPLDEDLATHAAALASSLRLRGADAVYAAVARQLGIPLVSWDGEQVTRAGAVRPSEA
jgi:predicted nucleic acid-binding protein